MLERIKHGQELILLPNIDDIQKPMVPVREIFIESKIYTDTDDFFLTNLIYSKTDRSKKIHADKHYSYAYDVKREKYIIIPIAPSLKENILNEIKEKRNPYKITNRRSLCVVIIERGGYNTYNNCFFDKSTVDLYKKFNKDNEEFQQFLLNKTMKIKEDIIDKRCWTNHVNKVTEELESRFNIDIKNILAERKSKFRKEKIVKVCNEI